MTNIEIKHLFRNNRFPESDSNLLICILYTPLGLLLVLLRATVLSFLFLIQYVLPELPITRKLSNKIATLGLGISVSVEHPKIDENVEIYISNNVSIFDHLAVSQIAGTISPYNQNTFEKLLKNNSFNFGRTTNRDVFKKNVSEFLTEKKTPLHFTPEGTTTNGEALIKFKTYPFEITEKVQPVFIKVERPIFDIAVSTLGSNYFTDLFYFMFCPVTNYKLRFLATLEKKSISNEEFAEITRQNIAVALKVELTDFTSNDLKEWEKKQLIEQRQRAQARPIRTLSPDLQRMSLQVKEVLPHVPMNAIYNDMCITRSVDSTITNILEGRINFVPEVDSPMSRSQATTTFSPSTSSGSSSKEPTLFFSKSATERSKSFQERKEKLIAAARKRYIEKHNLKLTV